MMMMLIFLVCGSRLIFSKCLNKFPLVPFRKGGLREVFKGVIYIMGKIMNLFLLSSIMGLTFYITSNMIASYAGTSEEATYLEIRKNGRLYVFTSSTRKADFEKSGELGKGIIKIGHGPNAETVVFDSDEAVIEYESRQVKQILDNLNIGAYQEFEKDGRVYVFTSPERKAGFERTGEMGKDYIAKIGYSSNGKTVMFDSSEAVREYDRRHEETTGAASETNGFYRKIEKDGRIYVFISPENMESFEQSGEMGKGIIKIGYAPNGETVIFDSDEAVKEYEKRNLR